MIAGRNVFTSASVDSIITLVNSKESASVKILGHDGFKSYLRREELKSNLAKPYVLDYLFSEHVDLLNRIGRDSAVLNSIAHCETSVFINDAYRLKPLIFELTGDFDPNIHFKLVNTGTISKYFNRWGVSEITYLGKKYLRPTINRKDFYDLFANAYSLKSSRPKLIVKGLNLLDACLDGSGEVVPGIPTLIVQSNDEENLLFAMAIINSKFASFYLKERFPASSYNQGTTFTVDMINGLPIPRNIDRKKKENILSLVRKVLDLKTQNIGTETLYLESKLDSEIFEIYKLSADEIKLIENRK
jgi:hypothetical protein